MIDDHDTEPTSIPLSDDWHQDEPMGYAVKCFDTTLHEYMTFADETDARRFAEQQEEAARDAREMQDWVIYPLYAGHGRHLHERRFS